MGKFSDLALEAVWREFRTGSKMCEGIFSVLIFKLLLMEKNLHYGVHITRVSQVLHTCVLFAKYWDKLFAFFEDFWERQTQVDFKIHFCHRFFSLYLACEVDTKDTEMLIQIIIENVIIASVAENRGLTLWSDSSQFDVDAVSLVLFEML